MTEAARPVVAVRIERGGDGSFDLRSVFADSQQVERFARLDDVTARLAALEIDWSAGIYNVDHSVRVRAAIDSYVEFLPAGERGEVLHFHEVGEYEIAFEALCLALMRSGPVPPTFDRAETLRLIDDLGLRVDSVLSGDLGARIDEWFAGDG